MSVSWMGRLFCPKGGRAMSAGGQMGWGCGRRRPRECRERPAGGALSLHRPARSLLLTTCCFWFFPIVLPRVPAFAFVSNLLRSLSLQVTFTFVFSLLQNKHKRGEGSREAAGSRSGPDLGVLGWSPTWGLFLSLCPSPHAPACSNK